MKIFLISNLYPSESDRDYGIFVRNIEYELEKLGAKIVHKAVISGRSKSKEDKVKKYKTFYSQIIAAYRKDDFDLIYLHFLSHSSPGLLMARALFGKKRKFVINVHGSDVLKFNKGILKWCNHKLLRETDLLVVPSHYFKQIIIDAFPQFSPQKIFVSPSGGIDFSIFKRENYNKAEVLHLGFVSRIEDDKGWKTFLDALLQLKEIGMPFKASIAGRGSKVAEMKVFIEENNLKEHVRYLDILSHQELNVLYNDLDLFIFPTKSSESLGLVGLEAMACGVPVIGSEIAGLKTFIEDGKNGYFISPGNETELVEKIKKFNGLSAQEQNLISEAAIQTAKKYDRKKVAADLYRKFQQLLP
jgi:glycosyltransferase involved in cell wall biosynthesis